MSAPVSRSCHSTFFLHTAPASHLQRYLVILISREKLTIENSFADREFYQDWWNSTTWDQFSRKWNKPVHTFLLRHVYASTMSGLQLSKASATFLTFLLSALCHELVMAVVTKKIRPYLFLMQVSRCHLILVRGLDGSKWRPSVRVEVSWRCFIADQTD